MRRALAVGCALLAAALPASSAERPLAVDLTVTGVEVTQAIQTPTNSIQLVSNRSTAVRATLGVSGSGGASVPNVTGRLHVFRNGSEITPAAGVAPLASLNAPVAPQRANENDTLNFELAAPTGILASADVDFRVDVTPVAGEANTANNSGAANNLTVVDRATPSLFFTRINYTPAGLGLPSDANIQPGTGDAFVRGIFPVNDGDPNFYRQGLFPSLTYSEDANGDGVLDAFGADGNDLLSLLASCRQLIVDNGLGANSTTFLGAWLAGNPIDGNGLAQLPGNNFFANTDPIRGQRSYAHEFTHNFGFDHIDRAIDQVGWDVRSRLPNNPAGNNTNGRVKPTTRLDVQVAGKLTAQAWVESAKYLSLLGNAILAPSGSASPDIRKRSRKQVLVIQGIFDPTGRSLRTLLPVFRYPWLSEPTRANARGRYVALVRTSQGVTKLTFDATVRDDDLGHHDKRETGRGFFEIMIPASGDVSSLEIVTLSGSRRLGAITRSKEPPRLQIVSPAQGGKLGRRTTVKWQASDGDTDPGRLMFNVAYSPNRGRTWVPVGVDIRGAQITFDSTQIQRAAGVGVIRVFVSDGLNTSFADVTGLSTSAARF